MRILLLVCLLIASNSTQAGITNPKIKVSGTLVSYDKNTATLLNQDTKTRLHVPRSSIKNLDGFIPGKAYVEVEVLPSELQQLNPSLAKIRKKSNRSDR
jgi:diacylglycerol kinase family enzyme